MRRSPGLALHRVKEVVRNSVVGHEWRVEGGVCEKSHGVVGGTGRVHLENPQSFSQLLPASGDRSDSPFMVRRDQTAAPFTG
jgi:hypothetical protein